MDLPEGKIRVLEVQLLGTPSIRLLLDHQLNYLHRRVHDGRNTVLIKNYMFVASLHKNCRIPHWHENPLRHVPGASTPDYCN
jgi:hypothetical protein